MVEILARCEESRQFSLPEWLLYMKRAHSKFASIFANRMRICLLLKELLAIEDPMKFTFLVFVSGATNGHVSANYLSCSEEICVLHVLSFQSCE